MYKITIEKITESDYVAKNWERLRDKYADDTESAKEDDDPQYGYVETESTRTKEEKIFEQLIDKIDLGLVIKAVNDLQH